jgi:hypothetical protein
LCEPTSANRGEELLVAEVVQSAAEVFCFDDLRDAPSILLMHGIGRRAKAVKPFLKRFGVDESVCIMQRIKHLAKNPEKSSGLVSGLTCGRNFLSTATQSIS